MTVAEKREKALEDFISKHNLNFEQERKLRKAVNSYYRLCARDEFALQMDNNPSQANSVYAHRYALTTLKWLERCENYFREFDLDLVYFGYLPTICYKGTTATAIERYFY